MTHVKVTEEIIDTPTQGIVGNLISMEFDKPTALIFRMPRPTKSMSRAYIQEGQKALQKILPEGVQAVIMGEDVDIFAITGEEATALRLAGKL